MTKKEKIFSPGFIWMMSLMIGIAKVISSAALESN